MKFIVSYSKTKSSKTASALFSSISGSKFLDIPLANYIAVHCSLEKEMLTVSVGGNEQHVDELSIICEWIASYFGDYINTETYPTFGDIQRLFLKRNGFMFEYLDYDDFKWIYECNTDVLPTLQREILAYKLTL